MRASLRFGLVIAAGLSAPSAATPATWRTSQVASVTDGDTFRATTGERVRIAGIDAPETQLDQAHCAAEIALGRAATARARRLLAGRMVTVRRVGRSWDRTVAHVRVGGRDVASALVAANAARWWARGAPKPDWCSGPAAAGAVKLGGPGPA